MILWGRGWLFLTIPFCTVHSEKGVALYHHHRPGASNLPLKAGCTTTNLWVSQFNNQNGYSNSKITRLLWELNFIFGAYPLVGYLAQSGSPVTIHWVDSHETTSTVMWEIIVHFPQSEDLSQRRRWVEYETGFVLHLLFTWLEMMERWVCPAHGMEGLLLTESPRLLQSFLLQPNLCSAASAKTPRLANVLLKSCSPELNRVL